MPNAINLTSVLRKIHEETDNEELIVEEIVDALKHRGYGPLLLTASLITVFPTGAIPGVPTATAILIICVAGQLLMGRKTPWIPKKMRHLSIKKEKFESARRKAEPLTKSIDKLVKPRLDQLTNDTANRIIALFCIMLALLLPPLEIVPFAAIVPALVIASFGIGLSAQDGLVIAVGLMGTALSIGLALYTFV